MEREEKEHHPTCFTDLEVRMGIEPISNRSAVGRIASLPSDLFVRVFLFLRFVVTNFLQNLSSIGLDPSWFFFGHYSHSKAPIRHAYT